MSHFYKDNNWNTLEEWYKTLEMKSIAFPRASQNSSHFNELQAGLPFKHINHHKRPIDWQWKIIMPTIVAFHSRFCQYYPPRFTRAPKILFSLSLLTDKQQINNSCVTCCKTDINLQQVILVLLSVCIVIITHFLTFHFNAEYFNIKACLMKSNYSPKDVHVDRNGKN